jgi:hypothetical protein
MTRPSNRYFDCGVDSLSGLTGSAPTQVLKEKIVSKMYTLVFVVLLLAGGCGRQENDEVTSAIRTACTGQFENDGELAAYVARVVIQRDNGVSFQTQLLADQNACAANPSPNCLGCVTEVNESVYGE